VTSDTPRLRSLTRHRLQRIAEGLSEDEAWRLFQQVVDALVHMSSLGIVGGNLILCQSRLIGLQLHRDIKLTNIFIGAAETPL
jgi:translation initiation factor 2-alpha kinase 4